MAEREIARIEEELSRKYPDTRTRIRHRIGTLRVGEESVAIVAVSPHRARAFAACREGIERVKERVPIWKRELGAGREPSWVDARSGEASSPAGDIVRSMEDGK
jgi:molybdopterin synthase catalytic subunit